MNRKQPVPVVDRYPPFRVQKRDRDQEHQRDEGDGKHGKRPPLGPPSRKVQVDQKYYDNINKKVKATRDKTASALREIGCNVLPSQSNFLFVKFPGFDSYTIYTKFKDLGILIRQWDYIHDYVRISVGTDSDMDTLFLIAKEIMQK